MSHFFREVFNQFTRKPINFVYPVILFLFISLMKTFFLVGFLFLVNGTLLYTLSQTIKMVFSAVILVLLSLNIFLYKGGLYKGIEYALRGRRIKLDEFFHFSFSIGPSLALSCIFRILLFLLAFSPVLAIYLFSPSLLESLIIKALIAIFYLILLLVFNYFLFALDAIIVVRNYRLNIGRFIQALKSSVKLALVELKSLLPIYLLFAFNILLMLIPIINLVPIFVIFPLLLGGVLKIVERH